MRAELEAILYSREEAPVIYPEGDEAPIKSIQYIKTGDEPAPVRCRPTGPSGTGGRAATRRDRTESLFGTTESVRERTDTGTAGLFGGEPIDKTESLFGETQKTMPPPPAAAAAPEKQKKGQPFFIVAAICGCGGAGFFPFPPNVRQKELRYETTPAGVERFLYQRL
jgi:hypothetical protein